MASNAWRLEDRDPGIGLNENETRARRLRIILALLPAISLIVVLYLGGLILAGIQSLGFFPAAGMTRLSLDAYRSVFTRPEFFRSLILTTWVSLVSTAISTILALISALLMWRALHFKGIRPRWITFLFQFNLPIPHSVGAIAVLLLFSQSGLLARMAYAFQWISSPADFPELVFDRWGIGVILEYIWKTTVFTGVILLAALETAGDEHIAAARSLGANAWQSFRYVTLPLMRPALVSASILVFAFTFSGYEVPYLLGERTTSLLPVMAYREFARVDLTSRPEGMAISLLITVIITCLVWPYMRMMERNR